MSDTNSFFTGLIVGAVAGAAICYLYAPRSGQESRELIKKRITKKKEKAAEFNQKVKQAIEEIKQKGQEARG